MAVHFRLVLVAMVVGCALLALISSRQQSEASRSLLENGGKGTQVEDDLDPELAARMPELQKGMQQMEQRLLSLEVQIQEAGRSHSTSSSLLLRPAQRLLAQSGTSAEVTLSSYKISSARFPQQAHCQRPKQIFQQRKLSTRMTPHVWLAKGAFGRVISARW